MNEGEMGGHVARMSAANNTFTVKPFKWNDQLGDIGADYKIFEKRNMKMRIGTKRELHNTETQCTRCVSNRILHHGDSYVVLGSTDLGEWCTLPKVHIPIVNVSISVYRANNVPFRQDEQ